MKKKILLTICLITVLALFAGCGEKATDAPGKVTSTPGDGNLTGKPNTNDQTPVGGGSNEDTDKNEPKPSPTPAAELSEYIGNIVSDDYILYKEASEKNGSIVSCHFYDYDDNWNKIWSGMYEGDTNEKFMLESYFYNLYNGDENIPTDKNYAEGFAWDTNGNKVKHYKNGIVQHTYVYDSNNNMIESHTLNNYGHERSAVYYEYDDNGNLIKESNYSVDKGYISGALVYYYDENGNRTGTDSLTYKEDGSIKNEDHGLTGTWFYEYDEFGRIIKLYNKLDNGGTSYTYEYGYDEKGHLIMIYDKTFRTYSYYCDKASFVHSVK